MAWNRKHLLDIESLSADEITTVLDTANEPRPDRAMPRGHQRWAPENLAAREAQDAPQAA